MRWLVALMFAFAATVAIACADGNVGNKAAVCGSLANEVGNGPFVSSNGSGFTCGWYQTTLGVAPAVMTTTSTNVGSRGMQIVLSDNTVNPKACIATGIPSAPTGNVPWAAFGGVAEWDLRQNVVFPTVQIEAESNDQTNGGNGVGASHDNPFCAPVGGGAYIIPYASLATGFVERVDMGGSTVLAGSAFPVTVTSITNPPAANSVVVGQEMFVGAIPYAQPNTQCTAANSCETWIVSSCTPSCGSAAITQMVFTGRNGIPFTAFTHTSGSYGMTTGNGVAGTGGTTNLGAPWSYDNASANAYAMPFRFMGPNDTPTTVANSLEFLMPTGGISEDYGLRYGNNSLICGQVQGSQLTPHGAEGCVIFHATKNQNNWGYFFAATGQGAAAFPVDPANCTALNQDCYGPFNDTPNLNGATVVNGEFVISNAEWANEYVQINHSGSSAAGPATDTMILDNQAACNVNYTSDGNAWPGTSNADLNSWINSFNGNLGGSNCKNPGDGNTYQAVNIDQCVVSGGTPACTAPNSTIGIECNGPCGNATEGQWSQASPHGPEDLLSLTTTQLKLTACAVGVVNTACSMNNAVLNNTGVNRFTVGSVVKLRNGLIYFMPKPDSLNNTWFGSSANGQGYFFLIARTTGAVSIGTGADGNQDPLLTFADANGGSTISVGPQNTVACSNRVLAGCTATVPVKSLFGSGSSNWTGNTPSDPYWFSGTARPSWVSLYAVPAPANMAALGAQPFIYSSAAEAMPYAYNSSAGANVGVDTTVTTGNCSTSTACTGSVTITCSTQLSGGPADCAAPTAGISASGLLLSFDCKTLPSTNCEQHSITVNQQSHPTTFTVTLNNSHGGSGTGMVITGMKPPMASNSSANVGVPELLGDNSSIQISYVGNLLSGAGTAGSNCDGNYVATCNQYIGTFQFHPAQNPMTSDGFTILAQATTSVFSTMTLTGATLAQSGTLYLFGVANDCANWGGSGAGSCVMEWTNTAPQGGGAWSATQFPFATFTATGGGGACQDVDIFDTLCTIYSNANPGGTNPNESTQNAVQIFTR